MGGEGFGTWEGEDGELKLHGSLLCRLKKDRMRNLLKIVFSPWVILGAAVVAAVTIGGVAWLLFSSKPVRSGGVPTAVVVVIPAPTSTQPGVVVPTETPAPIPSVPASPPPGVIAVGATVEISRTGGEGLNLRDSPGLNSNIQYLGFESEIFVVSDGPQEIDGLTWWYLVGFFDESRSGWAASNFLEVIQNP